MQIDKFFKERLSNFKPYNAILPECNIRLDANESFLNIHPKIIEEIIEQIKTLDFNRYPDSSAKELCKVYGQYIGIDGKNIMAGNGSDDLIQIIINTFIDKGDKLLCINPDFSMYKVYGELAFGKIVLYELDKDFKLDIDNFIKSIKKENPKLILLSNPNNPTGGIIKKQDIIKILENSNAIVVIDEAYYDFSGESIVNEIEKYENLIVLRTCSKALAAASLRLGLLITNSKILEELKKYKQPFNVNLLSQKIGITILKNTEINKEALEKILEEKAFLQKELEKIKRLKAYPSHTNFFLIEFDDAKKVHQSLLEKGIFVRKFTEGRVKDFLRITVGNREENEILIKSLKDILT